MKKRQKQILYLTGIFAGILVVIYLLFSIYFRKHFFYGTTINEQDCTGMTVKQVVEKFNLNEEQKTEVEELKSTQPGLLWMKAFFTTKEVNEKMPVSDNDEGSRDFSQNGFYEETCEIENNHETSIKAAELSKLEQRRIIYSFGERQEILEFDIFQNWLIENSDGTLQIKKVKVQEYIEKLCGIYSSKDNYRNFWGSDGELHRVSPGNYGWEIDKEKEVDFLMNHLLEEEGETVHQVTYLQEAASREERDWGNTYLEINLKKQHLWGYKDGELIIDTPIVTGNLSKNCDTPEGIYSVYEKARNRTLRGATYRSFVNYWMPIYGNIGIHDATWRTDFGGSIYETNGSHGCVNVPKDAMSVIYENMEVGTPVILYD